jgi:hypothetical protein
MDVSAAGSNQSNLWAMSTLRAPNTNDFYLYKYNNSTGKWTATTHYGVLMSASSNGRCYHINSSNQIWWGTLTSNGQIPNGSDIVQFIDISVSNSNGAFYLYVIGSNASGQKQFWRYMSYPNGQEWKKLSILWPETFQPVHIACDPKNGKLLYLTTNGVPEISTNAGVSWAFDNNSGTHDNAAWSDGNIIIRETSNHRIWIKKAGGSWRHFGETSPYFVSSYENFFYWITSDGVVWWYPYW